jgi:hypothetical protein
MQQGERRFVLKNEYLLVHIGGTLPDGFLKQVGVTCQRHTGEQPQRIPNAAPSETTPAVRYAFIARALIQAFFWVSMLGLLLLAAYGARYYGLRPSARVTSPLHHALRPAGRVGHGVGIAATAVMLLNFFYSARKRTRRLRGFGVLSDWLDLHMLIGTVTPAFIAFHAAFQANNALAAWTAAALAVVVGTGMFGRFLYTWVPTEGDAPADMADLLSQWEQLRRDLEGYAQNVTVSNEYQHLSSEFYNPPARDMSLARGALALCRDIARLNGALWRLHRHFPSRAAARAFATRARRLVRLRLQVGGYNRLRRLLRAWQICHIVLSVLLVVVITAHIGVALYLGYGWVFF